MGHRNGIFALVALALSVLALAGMLSTDAYSNAMQAEASGDVALTHLIANDVDPLCFNDTVNNTPRAALKARMHQAVAQ